MVALLFALLVLLGAAGPHVDTTDISALCETDTECELLDYDSHEAEPEDENVD